MKKILAALLITLAIAVVLVDIHAGRSITITAPSDANGPVVPGHGFFITGTIAGTLPDDVSMRVSVLNASGDEVRFAEASRKNRNVIDRFCDAFFYYYDDDPERLTVNARELPCLIVDDSGEGLRNANIKCWFSDKEFNAFIPYATDAEHGLIFDDGIGCTDAHGISYDALPDGEYTAYAVLRDKGGRELASQKKAFSIRPAENALICRFHPDVQYERMMKFAAENKLSMAIDYLPGYYEDPSGNSRSGLRAMFIGADVALYKDAHVHMFEYLAREKSITLTDELAYIEKYFSVDDPERFTVWRYDIGEPVIHVNGRTLEGAILRVDSGDKLCLCRADLTVHGTDGFLDLSEEILSTDTDFSDGVTLKASGDCRLAISGLVVPYQLKDEEIVFDPANNRTGLLNGAENIVYIVWDGTKTTRITKPVKMIRKFADGWTDDSVMEFYHVFTREEIDPGKDYSVMLYAIDKNGVRIDGTTESFVINNPPAKNIEGISNPENLAQDIGKNGELTESFIINHAPARNIEGTVSSINNFGNVTLGISEDIFRSSGFEEGDIITADFGGKSADMPFVTDYTDVKRGEPLAVAREGRIELWRSMGNFAMTYGIAESQAVTLSMKQKAGYLESYELRRELAGMKPVKERQPGQSEEDFANFREVATTGMKRNTLFRSSSPVNDRAGRKTAAEHCIESYDIGHIINLYDTEEQEYSSKADVVYIRMGLDYTSARFGKNIADVMNYIAQNEGKYVIHCVLGEHRTGAVCMILSALMGASYDELAEDYMLTCRNLYGVQPGTKQYSLLLDDNVNSILLNLFGVHDPKNADLKHLAEDFVMSTGITEETLARVREHLAQ